MFCGGKERGELSSGIFSGIWVSLLLIGILTWGFNIQPVEAQPTLAAHNLDGVRVALYNGPGVWWYDNITLPILFEWMGCNVTPVNGTDIRSGCLNNFDVLVWPGGAYGPYWEDLGPPILGGKSMIQDFVRNGGAYLGICAGAYIACDYIVWYDDPNHGPPDYKVEMNDRNLDLFPGVAHGSIHEIAIFPNYTMTRINIVEHAHPITDSLATQMQIFYSGGPYLLPYEGANISILGTYDVNVTYPPTYPPVTNPPAIVAFEYGSGRVFLTGVHPELWELSDVSNWPLLLEAMKWLARADIKASVETATGSGEVSFSPDSGMLEGPIAVGEASLPTAGKPNAMFPHGFFSFNITGLTEGQTVTVTITFPSKIPVGTQYWTCQGGLWSKITIGDDEGGYVMNVALTDGWKGDADGLANGVIMGTGGPGVYAHALAISNISPYRIVVCNRTVTSINVTVVNQGSVQEAFTVILSYNSTAFVTQMVTVGNGSSANLSFSWNTTGVSLGNYTIEAAVGQLPGETDTADNSLSTQIQVCILGDINGDGRVDMKDVSKVAQAFQVPPSSPKWTSNGDLDENGVIDMKDVSTIAKHFGEHV